METRKIDHTPKVASLYGIPCWNMEVFVVSGAPMSMSSRPGSALKKAAVFQNPQNRPPPRKSSLKKPIQPSMKKKSLSASRKVGGANKALKNESVCNDSSSAVMVKMPSVDDDDGVYISNHSSRSNTPASSIYASSSSSSSKNSDNEEENKAEPDAGSSSCDDSFDERGNFSGTNSPWFQKQQQEVTGEEKPADYREACVKKSLTPETLVQLIDDDDDDDVESMKNEENCNSHEDTFNNDENCSEEENAGIDPAAGDPEAIEGGVLAEAIAGNKKRLERILDSDSFYSSIKNNEEKEEESVNLKEEEGEATAIMEKSEEVGARRADSTISQGSADTVTLPSSCAFTPDHNEDINGGYNDILNVLERLEKETNDEDKDSGRPLSESPKRTISSAESSNCSSEKKMQEQKQFGGSKISDLLTYLDSVENEKASATTKDGSPMHACTKSPMNSKIADLACESSVKLAEQMVNLEFVVEEKERAIEVLRQALEHQRRLSANFSQKFQKELKQRLAAQKTEYEATVHRHQNFIDQLIEDKKSLAERCDFLTLELSNAERKFQDSLKNQEQRHTAEIRRLKSLAETSNKLKQEKWVDEKTKRIKEQTVRGLEPEIQRLLARHNAELADLEAERERRLQAQERELHQRHLQHIRELRAQWEEENADGWIHERQILTQRHNQQIEELTVQHQDEVERLQEQLRRERSRGQEDRAHYEHEASQVRRIAHERAQAEIERIREEEETKRKALGKKHAQEMVALKETEAAERADWERKCRQKLDEEWKQQEDGLRDKFRKERDSELDRVIQKLEAEVISGRKEIEAEYQDRMSRMRAKYESEMSEFSREAETMREKWANSRDMAAKREEELIVINAILKQKEVALSQALDANAKFEAEREDVRQAVRGEFSSAMESLTTERSNLLNQMSELRLKLAEAQSEKEAAEKEWRSKSDEEAAKIHAKVKAAILKKDETICELQRNYERAMEECQHLEALLQRQTKQNYLSTTPKSRPGRK